MITYLQRMITINKLDTEDVLIVIEQLQPLGAPFSRQPTFDSDLSNTSWLNVPLHHTLFHKRLENLWLVKPPHK